jgi:hypothetical protein
MPLLLLGAGLKIGTPHAHLGLRNLTNHRYPELRAGGFVSPGQPRSVYEELTTGFEELLFWLESVHCALVLGRGGNA